MSFDKILSMPEILQLIKLKKDLCSPQYVHPEFSGVHIKYFDDFSLVPNFAQSLVQTMGRRIVSFSAVAIREQVPLHDHREGEIYFFPTPNIIVLNGQNQRKILGKFEFFVVSPTCLHGLNRSHCSVRSSVFSVKFM